MEINFYSETKNVNSTFIILRLKLKTLCSPTQVTLNGFLTAMSSSLKIELTFVFGTLSTILIKSLSIISKEMYRLLREIMERLRLL